jgi:hypothetical protein
MSKLQRISAVFPWVFTSLFIYILWEAWFESHWPGPYENIAIPLGIVAYGAYVWHTSERELQLLRLIQHYREED